MWDQETINGDETKDEREMRGERDEGEIGKTKKKKDDRRIKRE